MLISEGVSVLWGSEKCMLPFGSKVVLTTAWRCRARSDDGDKTGSAYECDLAQNINVILTPTHIHCSFPLIN